MGSGDIQDDEVWNPHVTVIILTAGHAAMIRSIGWNMTRRAEDSCPKNRGEILTKCGRNNKSIHTR